jgi:hypothetical protein
MRTSLEVGIKVHRFAGIFPEQFSTEAGATARRWWPPTSVWSSDAFAMISPASSTMFLMCPLQSALALLNAPIDRALVQPVCPEPGVILRRHRIKWGRTTRPADFAHFTQRYFLRLRSLSFAVVLATNGNVVDLVSG